MLKGSLNLIICDKKAGQEPSPLKTTIDRILKGRTKKAGHETLVLEAANAEEIARQLAVIKQQIKAAKQINIAVEEHFETDALRARTRGAKRYDKVDASSSAEPDIQDPRLKAVLESLQATITHLNPEAKTKISIMLTLMQQTFDGIRRILRGITQTKPYNSSKLQIRSGAEIQPHLSTLVQMLTSLFNNKLLFVMAPFANNHLRTSFSDRSLPNCTVAPKHRDKTVLDWLTKFMTLPKRGS